MPKVNLNVKDYSDVDAAEGFNNYAGPTPPKGAYICKTGLFRIVDNSSGDPMFKIIFEIAEPKGSKKAQYNGYAIWHNANITQQGAPYLNAMLDALGLPRKAVWSGAAGGIVTSKENPEDVVKIGGTKVRGIEVFVTTKRDNYPVGSDEWNLKATSFSSIDDVPDRPEEDDDDDEGVAAKVTKGKKKAKKVAESEEDSDDDDAF